MKKSLLFFALLGSLIFIASCKSDDPAPVVVPASWVATYSNVVLGDQNNYTNGHFLQPQTGLSIALEDVGTQDRTLAMLFFTESGGANSILTFPADGDYASTSGTSSIRLFTQVPGGINDWNQSTLNSGMIDAHISMTPTEFSELLAAKDWTKFNEAYKANNNGDEVLVDIVWALNPKAGDVYLLQFNGLVRAIMYVKGVVTSGASGGNIRFDMIVEGRDIYSNNSEANQLQPLKR